MNKGSRSALPMIARYAVLVAVIILVLIAVDIFLGKQDKIVTLHQKTWSLYSNHR